MTVGEVIDSKFEYSVQPFQMGRTLQMQFCTSRGTADRVLHGFYKGQLQALSRLHKHICTTQMPTIH